MRMLAITAALAAALSTPAAAVTLGWNSAPEVLCGWLGTGTSVFYTELSTGEFLFSNDVLDVASLQAACPHGNILAWHVVNTTTGAFDQTVVYPK